MLTILYKKDLGTRAVVTSLGPVLNYFILYGTMSFRLSFALGDSILGVNAVTE